MITEALNAGSPLSQTQKSNKDIQQAEKGTIHSNAANVRDVVEISGVKPVQPVTDQKHDINPSSDAKNADKDIQGTKGREHSGSERKQTEMTEDEAREVEDLKKRDSEVRRHEQAHIAAAGAYAQGVSFEYQSGPDGRVYAVGGEVSIDTSEVPGNPDATIAKARTIRNAANAPAHPSGQDRQVAAAAMRMEADARMEKMEEAREESSRSASESNGDNQYAGTQGKTEGSKDQLPDEVSSAYNPKETEIGRVLNEVV